MKWRFRSVPGRLRSLNLVLKPLKCRNPGINIIYTARCWVLKGVPTASRCDITRRLCTVRCQRCTCRCVGPNQNHTFRHFARSWTTSSQHATLARCCQWCMQWFQKSIMPTDAPTSSTCQSISMTSRKRSNVKKRIPTKKESHRTRGERWNEQSNARSTPAGSEWTGIPE